ncbi:MAG: hypothetical protein AAFY41_14145 [Bacteroidota bacterium]
MDKKLSYDALQADGLVEEQYFVRTTDGKLMKKVELSENEQVLISYRLASLDEKKIIIEVYEHDSEWYGKHLYYFHRDGKLFYYEHSLDVPNAVCADTLIEKTSFFFDELFNVASQQVELFDQQSKPIDADSCLLQHPYKHYFYSNLEEFMLKVENYRSIHKRH